MKNRTCSLPNGLENFNKSYTSSKNVEASIPSISQAICEERFAQLTDSLRHEKPFMRLHISLLNLYFSAENFL